MIQGIALILVGILLPMAVKESTFQIYFSLARTLQEERQELLVLTAMQLVLMNCIRAVPHYLGAFLLSESLKLSYKGKRMFACNILFTFTLIILVYYVIDLFYGIRYDFGVPAFLIVCFILLLSYMNLFSVNMFNKILTVSSLLLSIQWLDVVPRLSGYGFGRGEISMDVKRIAVLMGYDLTLEVFSISMFVAFLFCMAMQVQLLYKEHKLTISTIRNRQVEEELHNTQLQALQLRSFREVQNLVHDLKTPLTTVQGLVSLSEMMEQDEQLREYLAKISGSVSSMGIMISEILYEDRKSEVTTEELMRSVLAHISITVPPSVLSYVNECKSSCIMGNSIRLSRAIINTIENAYQAIDRESGKIEVKVSRENGVITIRIRDNGKGIAPEKMANIWDLGYSENESTGLGLGFIRQVIENHNGSISITSEEKLYTQVTICLREVE